MNKYEYFGLVFLVVVVLVVHTWFPDILTTILLLILGILILGAGVFVILLGREFRHGFKNLRKT